MVLLVCPPLVVQARCELVDQGLTLKENNDIFKLATNLSLQRSVTELLWLLGEELIAEFTEDNSLRRCPKT